MAFEIISSQIVARGSAYQPNVNTPVDTSSATAVLIFVACLSQPAGTPTVKVGNVTANYLGKINNGTNSSAWAFALIDPPKGAVTQVNITWPNTYMEGGTTGIVVLDGALSFGFFDAKTGNPDIVLGGTTLKGGGKVISFGHGAYINDIEVKTGTGGSSAPIQLVKSLTANANCPSVIASMDYSGIGVAVTTTIGKPATTNNNNPYGGVMVEVEGSSAPPKQTVSPGGIASGARFGAILVTRVGEKIVGPSSIVGTRGIGTPTVTKQTLAIWDAAYSNADLTLSGSPALVVEKTAAANVHSLVLGSLPVAGNEKKYMEFTVNALGATTTAAIGFTSTQSVARNVQLGAFGSSGLAWTADGQARMDNAGLSGRLAWAVGDVLMVAIDTVNGWVFFGKNGVWQNAGNASQAVNFENGDGKANNSAFVMGAPGWPVFDGHIVGDKITANFGRAAFAHTMPTGYSALDAAPVASPKTITMTGKASSVAFGAAKANHVLHGTGIASTAAFGTHVIKPVQSLRPLGIASTAVFGTAKVNHILKGIGKASSATLGTAKVIQVAKPSGIATTTALGTAKIGMVLKGAGLPSAAAFGSAKVNHKLTMTGKASSAVLGSHKIGFSVKPSGIVSTAALGAPKVHHRIVMTGKATGVQIGVFSVKGSTIVTMAGKASSAVLGSFSVLRGAVTLSAPGIASTALLGSFSVARGKVTVAANGIAATARFGAHKLNFVVKTSGLAVGSALGTPLVKGKYALGPSGISSASALGQPAILRGAVHVTFVGLPASSALGIAGVTTGATLVSAPGIAASSSAGSPTLTTGKVTVSPVGKATSAALGTPLVSTGRAMVAPAGIASLARFGTQRANHVLHGTGIASLARFGTAKTVHRVQTVGLAPTGGVGTHKVGQKFQTVGISSAARFGTHVLTPGRVTVNMTGVKSGGVGTPLILTGALVLVPVAITSTARFGTAALARGAVSVSPAGIAKTSALGAPFVSAGGAMVAPNGIPSTARYGAHALTAKVTVTMTGIALSAVLGQPSVKAVSSVLPAGIAPSSALGTARAIQTTYVMSITGKRAIGAVTVQAGARTLAPTGIASTSALGAPVLLKGQTLLRPPGIAPKSALGIAALSTGPVTVRPASVVTGGMGQPSVKQRIAAMGIDSTAAFGQLRIEVGTIALQAPGIASKAALGTHQVQRGGVSVAPVGIPRAAAVGQPVVVRQEIIRLPGLPSGVAFGVSIIRTSGVQVEVPGIASGERFGLPYAFVGERPLGLPAYSFKVEGQVWKWMVPKSEAGGFFQVPTMQTFKFKVPRRAK